jgi:protein SCO1/2
MAAAEDAALTPASIKKLSFDQHLGSRVSLDLAFQDETGRACKLGDYFQDGPVILALGYYECPMLCNLVLNGVVESLQEIRQSESGYVTFVFISIDPKEAPELARAKKQTYLKRFGRPGTEAYWHFLTSSKTEVARLAREIGFHYAYDPERKQYAHPSGIVVLTPSGAISHYCFGVSYPAKDLDNALIAARSSQIGTPASPLLMLCSQFMALTGKHSAEIMGSVRGLAVLTMLALAGIITGAFRRSQKNSNSRPTISSKEGADDA